MLILQNKGGVIMKGLRRFISTFLVTVMAVSLLSACEKPAENNSGSSTKQSTAASVKSSAAKSGSTATDTSKGNNPVAGKKVAYIMIMPSATIFQMWKDSCQKLCDALDVKFDFFFCDGDFNKCRIQSVLVRQQDTTDFL